MVKNVGHLFMCSLTICVYSSKKCLFKFFAHLRTGLFVFLLLNYKYSLYILFTGTLSDIWFVNTFSHSVNYFFTFLIVSFEAQSSKFCWNLIYLFFSFGCLCFKKSLPNRRSLWFMPVFSSKYYTVHGILQARILEWVLFPSPGDLSNPGIEPRSPALQADSLLSHQGSPGNKNHQGNFFI